MHCYSWVNTRFKNINRKNKDEQAVKRQRSNFNSKLQLQEPDSWLSVLSWPWVMAYSIHLAKNNGLIASQGVATLKLVLGWITHSWQCNVRGKKNWQSSWSVKTYWFTTEGRKLGWGLRSGSDLFSRVIIEHFVIAKFVLWKNCPLALCTYEINVQTIDKLKIKCILYAIYWITCLHTDVRRKCLKWKEKRTDPPTDKENAPDCLSTLHKRQKLNQWKNLQIFAPVELDGKRMSPPVCHKLIMRTGCLCAVWYPNRLWSCDAWINSPQLITFAADDKRLLTVVKCLILSSWRHCIISLRH